MPNCPPIDGRPVMAASVGAAGAGAVTTPVDRPEPQPLAPPGHIGPLRLTGSGRLVWWTGRVAIGLRHGAAACTEPCSL